MGMREGLWAGLLGLLSSSAGASAGAAELPARNTVVWFQPQVLRARMLGVGVERAVGERVALAASVRGAGGLFAWPSWSNHEPRLYSRHWGVAGEVGLHVHATGRALEGFWVGPHLEVSTERISGDTLSFGPLGNRRGEASLRSHSVGGGARAGYTTVLAAGLSARVGLGLTARRGVSSSVNFTLPDEQPDESTSVAWSIAPQLTLGLGWAF